MANPENDQNISYIRLRRHGMAAPETSVAIDENLSDYGSDLDTDVVNELLSQAETDSSQYLVLESIEEDASAVTFAHVPHIQPAEQDDEEYFTALEDQQVLEVPGSAEQRASTFCAAQKLAREGSHGSQRAVSVESESNITEDDRSPLERFRTSPKKPLSVTDLVSPAWCELQYWYTLTKHGRKKATPAMKQGSKVHKVLEEQVHQFVPVHVDTREDSWGLRIWNVIQGLRTLRSTGMTRELEIWGIVDGQVVNGVIDELSYTPPDKELEKEVNERENGRADSADVPPNQTMMTDFLKSNGAQQRERKVYIIDVKTRMSKTLPRGSSQRPTLMQLMLYRKLLADLATNNVSADVIFDRYRLKATEPFTDGFIAEIGNLDFNFRGDSGEETIAPLSSQQDSVSELLAHNSVAQLWGLMIEEFMKTIRTADAVGHVLKAEFRSQKSGEILGSRTFAYDEPALRAYIDDEMKWWKGEREARGVDIEEAFKCRICEFAEVCTWRKAKIDEATENFRARSSSRKAAAAAA